MTSALNHLSTFAVNGSWYCTSVHFSALGKDYTAVCGMVEGYQYGSMDGFVYSTASKTPDDLYAEGISITHGSSPRRHLWTYVVGLNANPNSRPYYQCPYTVLGTSRTLPFLEMIITVTLEILAETALVMATSILTVCGTTLVPPVCLAPLAVTIPTSLGSRRS